LNPRWSYRFCLPLPSITLLGGPILFPPRMVLGIEASPTHDPFSPLPFWGLFFAQPAVAKRSCAFEDFSSPPHGSKGCAFPTRRVRWLAPACFWWAHIPPYLFSFCHPPRVAPPRPPYLGSFFFFLRTISFLNKPPRSWIPLRGGTFSFFLHRNFKLSLLSETFCGCFQWSSHGLDWLQRCFLGGVFAEFILSLLVSIFQGRGSHSSLTVLPPR